MSRGCTGAHRSKHPEGEASKHPGSEASEHVGGEASKHAGELLPFRFVERSFDGVVDVESFEALLADDTAVLPAAVDVPEPGTLALFGSGLALFATLRHRRKAKA